MIMKAMVTVALAILVLVTFFDAVFIISVLADIAESKKTATKLTAFGIVLIWASFLVLYEVLLW